MNRMTVLVLVFLVCVFTNYTLSQAKRFEQNSYDIDVMWKEKKKKELTVWGKIVGGKKTCRQMNYCFYFRNSVSGKSARVEGYIDDYRPDGRNNFKTKRMISNHAKGDFHKKASKSAWFVKKYTIDCLN